jgi:hypothetical protein
LGPAAAAHHQKVPALAHAWMLAFMLAALLGAIVVVPALLLGIRFRAVDLFEIVCWLTLGVIVLAQVAAFA